MATASKGLVHLDSKSAILHENLKSRILEGKREACELTFDDFDDVQFRIVCDASTPQIVKVNMLISDWESISKYGGKERIKQEFGGMEADPDNGFSLALEFDCDNLPDGTAFLEKISTLKTYVLGAPINAAFETAINHTVSDTSCKEIKYRRGGAIYVVPKSDKVLVVVKVSFDDPTDVALSRVYLQEFVETQRTVRNQTTPSVTFSKDVPSDLPANVQVAKETSGFISFQFESKKMTPASKERAVSLLVNFRTYLHYHIKASKTYLHMRMRRRVTSWLKILNRAKPEEEKGDARNAKGKYLAGRK